MDFTTVVIYLKDLLATIMTLLMILSPAFGSSAEAFTAKDPEALVTSFAAVSDIHVETNTPESYKNLKNVLEGIEAGENIDTVVYTGDNVMNGQILENLFFYSAVRGVMPAENNIVLPGNHDYGNGEGNFEQLRTNFLANNALYLGNIITKDYFYRVIDGVYMVCLVSEDPDTSDFMMSYEQLEWLEGVLKEADEAKAPIFVFAHFPIRYLDWKPYEVKAAELTALLETYDVELYVHGHIHNNIDGEDNFYKQGKINCVNLCRITEITEYEPGNGLVIEVYENDFVIRVRNFIDGEWNDALERTFPITK